MYVFQQAFFDLYPSKSAPNPLTWKHASRHNGATFSTSLFPRAVRTWCVFEQFDLETCFAPQRRHFFDISLSTRSPNMMCFWKVWLGNMLRATTACTFSTSILPKVVRTWCALYIWTCKRASRHRGVQLFILLWPHGSNPPDPQIIGKTQCVATFLAFRAPVSSFFLFFLFLSSTLSLFYSSLFYSSLFCSSLLLFSSLLFISPYCRKFDF